MTNIRYSSLAMGLVRASKSVSKHVFGYDSFIRMSNLFIPKLTGAQIFGDSQSQYIL